MKKIYDPMLHFKGVMSPEMQQYLSHYMTRVCEIAEIEAASALDVLKRVYVHGLYEMKGGKLLKNGIYRYPEDPDLYPICKWELEKEVVFMYEYEITAIVQKDGWKAYVARID